jgi:hypothetical protein
MHEQTHGADGPNDGGDRSGPSGDRSGPSGDRSGETVLNGGRLGLARRRVLKTLEAGVGAAGVGVAGVGAAVVGPAAAERSRPRPRNPWRPGGSFYRGDHHIHTQYSPDAMNSVDRVVDHAAKYGLDWLVITDHGGVTHEKLSIDQVTPDIEMARREHPGTLVFQGLEWNIPGAEHATVFLPPGEHSVEVLRAFERGFDGAVLAAPVASGGLGKIKRATSVDGEPYAIQALEYLDRQVMSGRVPIALMVANHPGRRGLDSPHELRNWRDAAPGVAVGMEGAPGHQAEGIPTGVGGMGAGRGAYDKVPDPNGDSFGGYAPTDAENPYRTYGGFDWFTAKVGGLWDSMLAEGRPWWVTSTSDSHQVLGDIFTPGVQDYDLTGGTGTAVFSPAPVVRGDFWPGYYSATLVGAHTRRYLDVMRGLQAGRVIAVHGRLVEALEVRVRSLGDGDRQGVTLGGRTFVGRGDDVELTFTVTLSSEPTEGGFIPRLAKVDLIVGPVTGPADDRDLLAAPRSSVVATFEVPASAKRAFTVRHVFRAVQEPFYLRLRGSDGHRLTASGDPVQDVVGDADPWNDLWFYANPVFVGLV